MPVYNHAEFLPEAIESILSQTFSDYELLIIDDHSTDEPAEVIRRYAAGDARIRFKINSNNIGMVPNWNLCLSEAAGKYIKPVFSDDILSSPDALRLMSERLDADRGISLVGSARNFIDAGSRVTRVLAPLKGVGVAPGEKIINRCLYEQNNLIGEPTAVMFRKEDARRGFLPYYQQMVDLEMWLHLLEHRKFAFIDQPLCSFRIHPAQQTERNSNSLAAVDDFFHLCNEYMNKPYVNISAIHKAFSSFDNAYRIRKICRAGYISGERAAAAIEERYGNTRFRIFYPLYKLYKPLYRLLRKLGRRR
jgi:glycosyltransferase involved in cell wall biosynthesis